MTSYQLRQRIDALLSRTSTDHYLTKFLFILAKGYEHMAADLMEVLYVKNRTIFSKKQQTATERFYELRRQLDSFPVGQVFHEIIQLQHALGELQQAFEQTDAAFVDDLDLLLDHFYKAFEAFVRGRGDQAFVNLITEAGHLYENIVSARQVLSTVRQALQDEDPDAPGHLTLLFERVETYGDVVAKLGAVEEGYDEVCRLLGVSKEEHPLRPAKIETGSLWVCVQGEPRALRLLGSLFERFALFLYRRFSVEDQELFLPERVSATQSLLNLADELEYAGFAEVAADESRLRKSAIVLRRAFFTMLAGEPAVTINGKTCAVDAAVREQYIEQSKQVAQDRRAAVSVNGH